MIVAFVPFRLSALPSNIGSHLLYLGKAVANYYVPVDFVNKMVGIGVNHCMNTLNCAAIGNLANIRTAGKYYVPKNSLTSGAPDNRGSYLEVTVVTTTDGNFINMVYKNFANTSIYERTITFSGTAINTNSRDSGWLQVQS